MYVKETYNNEYNKRNIRSRRMNFNLKKEEDLEMMEWIDSKPEGISNYLKKLVAEDMAKAKKAKK